MRQALGYPNLHHCSSSCFTHRQQALVQESNQKEAYVQRYKNFNHCVVPCFLFGYMTKKQGKKTIEEEF